MAASTPSFSSALVKTPSEVRLDNRESKHRIEFTLCAGIAVALAAIAIVGIALTAAYFTPLIMGLTFFPIAGALIGATFSTAAAYSSRQSMNTYRLPLNLLPQTENEGAVSHTKKNFKSLSKRDREGYAQEEVIRKIRAGLSVNRACESFYEKYGTINIFDPINEPEVFSHMISINLLSIIERYNDAEDTEASLREIQALEATIKRTYHAEFIEKLVRQNCRELGMSVPKKLLEAIKERAILVNSPEKQQQRALEGRPQQVSPPASYNFYRRFLPVAV